jgi:hypothetical protein
MKPVLAYPVVGSAHHLTEEITRAGLFLKSLDDRVDLQLACNLAAASGLGQRASPQCRSCPRNHWARSRTAGRRLSQRAASLGLTLRAGTGMHADLCSANRCAHLPASYRW